MGDRVTRRLFKLERDPAQEARIARWSRRADGSPIDPDATRLVGDPDGPLLVRRGVDPTRGLAPSDLVPGTGAWRNGPA